MVENMTQMNESYMSSADAAKLLGIHPLAIQKVINSGRLPAEKIANRWILSREVVEELAKTYVPKRGRPRKKRKYTKRSSIWQQG